MFTDCLASSKYNSTQHMLKHPKTQNTKSDGSALSSRPTVMHYSRDSLKHSSMGGNSQGNSELVVAGEL